MTCRQCRHRIQYRVWMYRQSCCELMRNLSQPGPRPLKRMTRQPTPTWCPLPLRNISKTLDAPGQSASTTKGV